MKRSLREVLAESHVAAIAIATLLLWTLTSVASAFRIPFYQVAAYLVTAVAILGIPYSFHTSIGNWFILTTVGYSLYGALVGFAWACFLSRWVYGVGPFRALSECRARLERRSDA